MLGPLLFRMAKRMANSNGVSLAKALAARTRALESRCPHRPPVEYWQQALEARPGWKRVRERLYQFRTGDQFEFLTHHPPREWLTGIAQIELKGVAEGMNPPAREALVQEAVGAATAWWDQHGIHL